MGRQSAEKEENLKFQVIPVALDLTSSERLVYVATNVRHCIRWFISCDSNLIKNYTFSQFVARSTRSATGIATAPRQYLSQKKKHRKKQQTPQNINEKITFRFEI